MPPETPSARELARQLVARASAGGEPAADAAAAVHAACEHAYRELARWLGGIGCLALFTRALAQARIEHPALWDVRLDARSAPVLAGVAESVQTHGDAQVTAALEALLVTLLTLLTRFVGDDMVARLVEQIEPTHVRGDESLT